MPDMDAIGAAIGVRKMARMNNVEGYVIVNFNELDGSVTRLMDEIKARYGSVSINSLRPKRHLSMITEKSLDYRR